MTKKHPTFAHARAIFACFALGFVSGIAGAADITWNGTANDGDWGNPANWDGESVPLDTDSALLRLNGGTNSIALGADRTVAKIGLYNDAFSVFGQDAYTLTLTGDNTISNVNGSSGANILFNCRVALTANTLWALPYGTVTFGGDVTGNADITVSGGANRGLAIAGDFQTAGDINTAIAYLTVGEHFANPDGSTGTGGTLRGSRVLTMNGAADFGYKPTLTLNNTDGVISNRLGSGVTVRSGGQGMNITVNGNATVPAQESFGMLDLDWGVHNLSVNGTASAAMTLTINNLVERPGAFVWGSIGTNGKLLFPNASAPHGLYPACLFLGNNFATLAEDASLTTASYATLSASGNNPDRPATLGNASRTLEEDATVAGLKLEGSCSLALGQYDLTVSPGGLISAGYNTKTITSTGGRLVFGGNDILICQEGGATILSAPIAWERPAGNTADGPSIIIPRMWQSITFSGEDCIGEYGGIYTEGGNQTLTFDGPSDRTFNGPIVGKVTYTKKGTGTLRFKGPRQSYDWNAPLNVNAGRAILAAAPSFYRVNVSSNAVLEVADGATLSFLPTINAGATLGGIGTIAYASSDLGLNLQAGSWLSPGNDGIIGTLTIQPKDWRNPSFAPESGLRVKVDETSADRVLFQGWYNTNLPNSGKFNLDVSALDKTTEVTPSTQYTIMSWRSGWSNEPSNRDAFTWNITTSTPRTLDVSQASVRWNGSLRSFVLSGVRNAPRMTVLVVR